MFPLEVLVEALVTFSNKWNFSGLKSVTEVNDGHVFGKKKKSKGKT